MNDEQNSRYCFSALLYCLIDTFNVFFSETVKSEVLRDVNSSDLEMFFKNREREHEYDKCKANFVFINLSRGVNEKILG